MNKPFNAWKEGAPYYVPPLLMAVVLGGLLWPKVSALLALPFLILGVAILFFFRDPLRAVTVEAHELVCPADGTVVAIDELDETPHYAGPCRRVSIFLSLLDAHVNRSPSDGRVVRTEYRRGHFKNALKAKSADVNEFNAIWMETPHGPITVRQISGALARRIVCWPREGDTLAKGEKIGMIRFGSRTEMYLPRHGEVCVKLKQKVRAGTTIAARIS